MNWINIIQLTVLCGFLGRFNQIRGEDKRIFEEIWPKIGHVFSNTRFCVPHKCTKTHKIGDRNELMKNERTEYCTITSSVMVSLEDY